MNTYLLNGRFENWKFAVKNCVWACSDSRYMNNIFANIESGDRVICQVMDIDRIIGVGTIQEKRSKTKLLWPDEFDSGQNRYPNIFSISLTLCIQLDDDRSAWRENGISSGQDSEFPLVGQGYRGQGTRKLANNVDKIWEYYSSEVNMAATLETEDLDIDSLLGGSQPPPDDIDIQGENEPESSDQNDDNGETVFLTDEDFSELVTLLKEKKNIVLEGPPGVGKTFIAKKIADSFVNSNDVGRIEMIQFHQSYSYEDFIQGYRPQENGTFKLIDGIFYRFCNTAAKKPKMPFVLVIDEINRANLSKVFGELLLLLESDKRNRDYEVQLTYSKKGEKKFNIPPNIYLIGTMNTADRSLALVDYALRRRFRFIRLKPQFYSPKFQEHLLNNGTSPELMKEIIEKLTELNQEIEHDFKNLGPNFTIGHSYFCYSDGVEIYDREWYTRIIKYEIEPLLREYWFDKPEKVDDVVQKLLS